MKRYLLYIFIIFLGLFSINLPSFCDEPDDFGVDDDLTEVYKFDKEWRENQEAVTDEEFEKVMQRYEKKKKYKKYEFEPDEEKDMLNDMSLLNEIAKHEPTVLFPANVRSYEGEYIPAGYYKLTYSQKGDKHFLTVSQGRRIYATLEMQMTDLNYDAESIQFAEIIPLDNESVKLIYGNVDLNLEKKLYIKN